MSDSEAAVSPLKRSVNLVLRTVFHALCFVLFCGVLAYGFYIWFTISEEQATVPLLNDLKVLTPFFFTNWNFVTMPFGQMPVLDIDGKKYCQSIPIARLLGKKYGLAGDNAEEDFEIDQNVEFINDIRASETNLTCMKRRLR
ncbi:glutathione S-transferase [Danaus plexippus plexippus]|uniref:glutathione transferase n=1 Tax=Danaus plexippus plexippus TaxID=278856 RepID=A0A212EUH7_DANPL|nr:glutathione S-transferase [Danaus plexippus plexippus]